MPISIDEWNKGRDTSTLESQIEQFLRDNKGKAFTLIEITEHLPRPQLTGAWKIAHAMFSSFLVGLALEKLIQQGIVKSRIIKQKTGHQTYYMIP